MLVQDDSPHRADCILVLGGDEYGARILKAAELAKAGYASRIFVDGTPALIGNEADYTIQFAEQHGYAQSMFTPVHLPPAVNSTATEAEYVANQITRSNGIHSMLLVTSNFHTHRAAHIFRKKIPDLQITVIAAPDPFFAPANWWKTHNGKKTFLLEWTKTLAEWWA